MSENNSEKTLHTEIYALIDPRTHEVRYVGRSVNAERRKKQHIRDARKYMEAMVSPAHNWFEMPLVKPADMDEKEYSNIKKLHWIATLLHYGHEPVMVILDVWENTPSLTDAGRLEDAWIAQKKLEGHILLNHILTHRQNPSWYNGAKKGYANSPMEYVEMLKSGQIKSGKSSYGKGSNWRRSRRKLQKLNKPRKYNGRKRKRTK